ncbi:MAG TPA: hypothetical protein VMU36_08710, partial [Spirochaetia bacterium]|nr:hypothetical protein [Spirochaetia bacterium]
MSFAMVPQLEENSSATLLQTANDRKIDFNGCRVWRGESFSGMVRASAETGQRGAMRSSQERARR